MSDTASYVVSGVIGIPLNGFPDYPFFYGIAHQMALLKINDALGMILNTVLFSTILMCEF